MSEPILLPTAEIAGPWHLQPPDITEIRLAAEAADLMETQRVNQLLVLDEHGALAGALTMHDLMQAKVI